MNKQLDPSTHYFTTIYVNDGEARDEDDMSVTRIAEINVAIYPMDDEAFAFGYADDVLVEDTRTGEYRTASKKLSKYIFSDLQKHRPSEWAEIRAMGASNSKALSESQRIDEQIEDRLEHRELHKEWRDNE